MKRILFVATVVSFAASAFALQVIERKAPITQAVVYNDRVEVTRSYRNNYQPAAAGEYQVKFLDLPSALDDNSVRASGLGSAEVKINAVKIESVFLDTTTNIKYRVLEDSVDQLKEQVKVYDD
ncbi:MAG: DUF4140 domain-containing protein, partial [bacterium]|nr:DUF4140 domain-containing protein [bacterium]